MLAAVLVRPAALAIALAGWEIHAAVDLSKIPAPLTQTIEFGRDIQPILQASCIKCHGPNRSENSLRLDSRAFALQGGDRGPALVPGKASESLLLLATAHALEDLPAMPKKADPLTREQIALLRTWIDQGALWPTATQDDRALHHWAWKPPVRPSIPQLPTTPPVRNPIDSFIRSKLPASGLQPSPEADRITQLRRLHLDLIGLPPTPEQVAQFLADATPDAYGRKVEELLRSPHYGERWGRVWLDAARFADSDGYEKDKSRQVWFYRDWVVNAFNRDLPYDQFILQQLAGDQLPGAGQDERIATGFLRNSMVNEEGAIDPEQFRMDAMYDRMDAIGKSILGITIQCAQCHAHKYDPLAQEEYYRLFAFLNSDHEEQRVAYTAEEQAKSSEILRQISDLEESLRRSDPQWQVAMAQWEATITNGLSTWTPVQIRHLGEHDQHYTQLADLSQLASGYAPTQFTERWQTTNSSARITGFRLELLNDPNLPCNGPGRSLWGTCALTEFKVEIADAANPTNKSFVKLVHASADYSNPERPLESHFHDKSDRKRVYGPIEFAIDGKDETAWGINAGPGRRNVPRTAVFVPEKPISFPAGAILTFHLVQNHGGWNSDDHMNNNLGRFRLSVTDSPNPTVDPIPAAVREILTKVPSDARTPDMVRQVYRYWRTQVPAYSETNRRIESLWDQWPQGSTSLTLMAREEPRTTSILKRGDWLKPTRPVTTGTPGFLHPLPPNADSSRLTFARWLTDRRSPTTARVLVNRIWQQYFGTGIVETPEDFGLQSPPPSHPELLDWLAVEFMEQGWSMKAIHRLIVHSSTYRQSSHVSADVLQKDPLNRWLARSPRLRVDGEIVRDIALATSGLLNPKLGGPSIYAPAPEFLFQPPASYAPFPWKEETGPDRYRRALYTFRRRSTPYPALQVFDAPNGDFSCVRRQRSNTPLQALTALNEPLFVECARALALRVLTKGGTTDDTRLTYAFQCVVSRPPTPDEHAILASLLQKQRNRLSEGWVNPLELATGIHAPIDSLPPGTSPTLVAAYTAVGRALLNLDETITRE